MTRDAGRLLADLVAIDSINPDLVPGAAGEKELAHFVADWCRRAGLEVEIEEPASGRPNVIATARGSGGGRSLLLNAHMDTVGVEGMEDPFSGRVAEGRLYGRGAYDMKGGLAAIMLAASRAKEAGLAGDVIVTAVCDEEVASLGTAAIAAVRRADAAIVSEPTEERVCIAHKGFVSWEIETAGRAAHGSRPDLGVDAIALMGGVLVALEKLDQRLRAGHAHPLLGTGSVHASLIEGGQEYSSYPARCLLVGERRTIPGETPDVVEHELRELLGSLEGSSRVRLSRAPFETKREEPIVQLVSRVAGTTDVVGVGFWADSALLSAAGIPTLLFGPSGEGAHAAVEWVDLASVERCASLYLAVAESFCI
jgi:acetylornithine deacetylase